MSKQDPMEFDWVCKGTEAIKPPVSAPTQEPSFATCIQVAERISTLRTDVLFDDEGPSAANSVQLDPFAEHHFLLALAALETAASHMKLADLFLTKAKVELLQKAAKR